MESRNWIGGLLTLVLCFTGSITTSQQSIADIKMLPHGSVVTISGTVTTGAEWGQIRYLQDHTGGIALYSPSLASTIPGDSIGVTGVLSSYRGQLQISPVLSFQVIASDKPVIPAVIANFDSTTLQGRNSVLVTLQCPGIHTCEPRFSPGTVVMYDQRGNCLTAIVSEVDHLFGKHIYEEHTFVTGILYTLDGQQRLLIDSMGPEATCNNIHPPNAYYLNRHILVDFEGLPTRQTVVQWGRDDFKNQIDFEIPTGSIGVDFSDLPAAELYKVRVQQIDGQDTFYSKIIHFTPALSAKPVEIFFNRSVDASFSDGSHPTGTGGLVIEQNLIRRIDSVSTTLDIAMYNTGRDPIIQAINRALLRGVTVRYIAEEETSNTALTEADFPVFYRNADGIMHHKFIVGDAADSARAWVWTGSTNLTSNQLSTDPNHAYVIQNIALAKTYQVEFEEIWGEIGNHSDSKAGEVKDDNTCHLFMHQSTLIESYFSPSDETECHIAKAISNADHQLLIGLLLLTSDNLIDAVVDKYEEGVEVRVILEDEEASGYAVNRFGLAGVPYAIHDPASIYHHKIAIIDEGYADSDPTVVSGSHNWTWSADHINDENTLIFHDQSIANIFRQEFEARWSELTPVATVDASDDVFRIYPNPASTNITLDNPTSSSIAYELIDARGVVQQNGILGPNKPTAITIASSIPNGLYTIRMIDGVNPVVRKLVIQR